MIQQKTYFFKINFYWTVVALQCCIVSGAQQSESAIHISPLFGFLSFRSLQNTEWGSLCCPVGSLYLPIFIHSIDSVDTSIPSPIHPTPLGTHMCVREILYLCLVHPYIIETRFHETIVTLPVGKSLWYFLFCFVLFMQLKTEFYDMNTVSLWLEFHQEWVVNSG